MSKLSSVADTIGKTVDTSSNNQKIFNEYAYVKYHKYLQFNYLWGKKMFI